MSDPTEETPAARRPSPNPASRARRIGGRPAPAPRPAPRPAPQPAAAPSPTPATASTSASTAPAATPAPERAEAPAAKPTHRPPADRSADLRWLPAGVLAVAAAALLVIVLIASHGVYWAKPDGSAGARASRQEQVLAAAKKCFAQINSYDYRKLTGLVAKDLTCVTGTFTNDLKKALTTQILPLAPKAKAVQSAQINRAGVVSVSRDGKQWVTLIYGQLSQSNTSTGKNGPRIDIVGAVVTMDDVGGNWLISKVATDAGT